MIEQMNGLMRAIRQQSEPIVASGRLDVGLQQFLDAQGLTVHLGGVFFAEMLAKNGARTPYDTPTGHEARVNSFHPDDYLGTAQPDWATLNVGHSVLLAQQLLLRAAALTSRPIEVLITVDLGGFGSFPSSTFTFYGRRADDSWLPADLREIHAQAVDVVRL